MIFLEETMIRLVLTLFFGITVIPGLPSAQSITLDEFLVIVSGTHPVIEQATLEPQLQSQAKDRFLTSQDWLIQAGPSYYHAKPVVTSPFSPTTIDEINLGATLRKSLWSTGGRLSFEWFSNFTDQSFPDFQFPVGASRLYRNRVGLAYTQPLMKNYGGTLDRLDYDLSGYAVAVAELDALESQEALLLDMARRFVDWAFLEEKVRITEARLRLAEESLEQVEKKRRANLVDRVDVLRAEDAVRLARQNLVLIEAERNAKRAELAVLVQVPQLGQMTPDFDMFAPGPIPDSIMALTAIQNSRRVRALKSQQERLGRLRRGFTETGRPSLDLDLGLGITGGDDGLGSSLEITRPDFRIGLLFVHPVGGRAADSDVSRTDLQIRRVRLQIERTILDLESTVSGLMIQIVELERVLALNQEEIESARVKTTEEQRLYDQGRGELTFVIQSRDNEQNARLIYAENAARYHQLILQYRELIDKLLVPSAEG